MDTRVQTQLPIKLHVEFAANAVAQMNTKQLADRNREYATQAATRRRNVQWHYIFQGSDKENLFNNQELFCWTTTPRDDWCANGWFLTDFSQHVKFWYTWCLRLIVSLWVDVSQVV
ncbi:uncharacterized protein [Pocillopora verrucosa]|uniref:uncharacterized protein n=1 Tax=Pocillopora verrucosa TaxID=203993 RepID=UPI0033425857